MINIYIYDKTLNALVLARPVMSLEDFENCKKGYYPNFDDNVHVYSTELFRNPIFDKGVLREMTKKELRKAGKYALANNEIEKDGEIIAVELDKYEAVEGNEIKYDRDRKIIDLSKEIDLIKAEYSDKRFLWKNKYWQKNRETADRLNLIGAVVLLKELGHSKYTGWEMVDKDTEKPVSVELTLQEMAQLGFTMMTLVSKSKEVARALKEKILTLTDKQLKNFDSRKEYEKLWS